VPEEPQNKPSTATVGIPSDLLFKLLPYIILAAGYAFNFGRKDNNVDVVVQQLSEQRALITNIGDKVTTLSERISKVEGSQDSIRRDLDQERAYRDRTK
jgi:hypothetical protein